MGMVPKHFTEYRNAAVAANSAIVGISHFLVPIVVQWMNHNYGWRSSHAIMACFILQTSVLGMLMYEPVNTGESSKKRQHKSSAHTSGGFTIRQFVTASTVTLYLGYLVTGLGSSVLSSLMADYASYCGMTKQEGAILASTMGGANIAARMVMTFSGRLTTGLSSHLMVFSSTVKGVAAFLLVNMTTFWALVPCTCLFGAGWGIFASMQVTSLSELYGLSMLIPLLGICSMMYGIGTTFGAPIAGWYICK